MRSNERILDEDKIKIFSLFQKDNVEDNVTDKALSSQLTCKKDRTDFSVSPTIVDLSKTENFKIEKLENHMSIKNFNVLIKEQDNVKCVLHGFKERPEENSKNKKSVHRKIMRTIMSKYLSDREF